MIQKIKVLIILPSLEQCGPVIVAENIAKYCCDKTIKHIFLSLRNNIPKDINKFSNFEVHEIGAKKNPLLKKNTLIKTVDSIRPDIIHVHCFWPTILAGMFLKKYKLITTLHNNPLEDFAYLYGKMITFFMVKSMAFYQNRFDKVIAISEFVKTSHEKNNIKVHKDIIFNGIEEKEMQIETKSKEHITLVSVANLNIRKNIKETIIVLKALIDKDTDRKYRLVVIGDGEERDNIEKLISKLELNNNIKLKGSINRKDVFKYLFSSDLFISTTKSEGLGLSLIEAMMCKLPIITSNIPIMKELVDNGYNGYICSSVDNYLESIIKIIDNYDYYSENSFSKYTENFRVQNMSLNYNNIYRSMLNE